MSYSSFSNSSNDQEKFHADHRVSTHSNHDCSSSQLIFEENENETETETENDFELQASLLSFLFAYSQVTSVHTQHFSESPYSEKPTNPIYLSVCNFRI